MNFEPASEIAEPDEPGVVAISYEMQSAIFSRLWVMISFPVAGSMVIVVKTARPDATESLAGFKSLYAAFICASVTVSW